LHIPSSTIAFTFNMTPSLKKKLKR